MIALYTLVEMRIMDRRMTGSALTGKGWITMHDREKVIKGLYGITHYNDEQMFYNDIFIRGIADDALAMLKEQGAQQVIIDKQCEVETGWTKRRGFCPKCHHVVLWMLNREYCGFCGQAVKWE